MNEVIQRIEALDTSLFEMVPHQLGRWDQRALLGLEAAVASIWEPFDYLEIGSYLGGSLQVLIRDPRCRQIISVDPRLEFVPDKRTRAWSYEDNSTNHMMRLLGDVPDADMSKVVTLEMRSEDLQVAQLPGRPEFCFIDGEHTDEAVIRDGELCMAAIDGEGVIAFHDYPVVQPGIRHFLRTHWRDLSMAMALSGLVFVVEAGGRGALRSAAINRAIGSSWHRVAWTAANRARQSPGLFFATWRAMPQIDALAAECRRRFRIQRQH
jgi:hypothetical protein